MQYEFDDLNEGIYGHSMTPIYNQYIFIGGRKMIQNQKESVADVFIFDISLLKWKKIVPFRNSLFSP